MTKSKFMALDKKREKVTKTGQKIGLLFTAACYN
jgi:hypothetical protein